MSSKKYGLFEAKQKLEHFCAYQERCEFDVRKKLRNWKMPPDQQDILIADLITNNYLNEERFAEAYVGGKVRIKRWGKRKIISELKFRSISDYSIQKAIAAIDQEVYWENILCLTKKKLALLKERDPFKRKAKLSSFLSSKGYAMDLINEALHEALKIK